MCAKEKTQQVLLDLNCGPFHIFCARKRGYAQGVLKSVRSFQSKLMVFTVVLISISATFLYGFHNNLSEKSDMIQRIITMQESWSTAPIVDNSSIHHDTRMNNTTSEPIMQESWSTAPIVNSSSIHHGTHMNNMESALIRRIPNPYTTEALGANPYLGWAPTLVHSPDSNFSWRNCFYNTSERPQFTNPKTAEGLGLPGCNESPSELGQAPSVNSSWIPDVTMLHTMMKYGKDINGNPFPPVLSDELCEDIHDDGESNGTDEDKQCFRESMIYSTAPLHSSIEQNITINPSNHVGVLQPATNVTIVSVRPPKVLCLIYTMEVRHATRVRAIRETWAGGCDGFLAFSTTSDPRIPAIHIKHNGKEEYKNMWQKVRSIWKFVGRHYLDQFDWFYIGGDDLFALPQNLKNYLASLSYKDEADPRQKGYYVGLHQKNPKQIYFNTGGGGYALSQAALRKLLTRMEDTTCSPTFISSKEDVMIAKCLRRLGIAITDTRDSKGRERFHFWSPKKQFHWDKYGNQDPNHWFQKLMMEWGVHRGPQCCAPDSTSFHYVKQPAMIRHLYALIYVCKDRRRQAPSLVEEAAIPPAVVIQNTSKKLTESHSEHVLTSSNPIELSSARKGQNRAQAPSLAEEAAIPPAVVIQNTSKKPTESHSEHLLTSSNPIELSSAQKGQNRAMRWKRRHHDTT